MTFASRITRLPRPFDPDLGAAVLTETPWASGDVAALICGAAGTSPYLRGLIARERAWLEGALAADPDGPVPGLTDALPDEPEALGVALRQMKRRVALFAALADLGGVWRLDQVTGALSDLAVKAVDKSLETLLAAEIRRGKLPGMTPDDLATRCGLYALAMGKMGAGELNFSSDIDLILLFDETRYSDADRDEARASLIRVVRRMTAMISDQTGEGYVFRTDLRLRPDASVTPVVISSEAAEYYYESVGRTWERAAYIKARAAAGDIAAGEAFLKRLRPFVWRRHLDFAAIQDAHDMRLRIRDHKGLHGQGLDNRDIKLAPGGIREIEFFTQTRQLIAGGRDPGLRQRDTVGGLAALAAAGWVPETTAQQLTEDYRAHREIEHRLQMVHDAQTQALPQTGEGWERIACLCGTSVAELRADLTSRIRRVSGLTEDFFAPKPARAAPELSEEARETVARWPGYPALRSPRAVEIFKRLRPELLDRLLKTGRPDEALRHLDAFLRGLPAGVQIFSLLEANPVLIDLLIDIAATSPELAEYLGRNSAVFDAVIGGAFFQPLPDRPGLTQSLDKVLGGDADYETALNLIRRWWKEQHFRIGVQHLRGLISGAGAGHAYADLADTVVKAVFPLVVADVSRRHGPPPGRGAAVIGMGSLGAGWLTSGSDLDLIVIYDPAGAEQSDGPRPLAVRPYYARLTQTLVTALTAQMPDGKLYEVDMRLRPSGRQGPVATAFAAFCAYQTDEAWTWEYLALTRARFIAGAEDLGAEIEAFRRTLLAGPHDPQKILNDVIEMRQRIQAAKAPAGPWDFKLGPGGAQEIELLGQTAALLAGCARLDTPGQLASGVSAGWLSQGEAAVLTRAWEVQQTRRTALRLLTERPQDPAELGAGAERMMAQETRPEDDVQQLREAAAQVIETALGRVPPRREG